MLLSGGDAAWTAGDTEKIRLSREEDLYKQEMIRLEKDLTWVSPPPRGRKLEGAPRRNANETLCEFQRAREHRGGASR